MSTPKSQMVNVRMERADVRRLDGLVKRGAYASRSEVLRTGVDLVAEATLSAESICRLRDLADAGRISADELVARLLERFCER